MRRLREPAAAALAALLIGAPAGALDTSKMQDHPVALLRGLDKITAKTSELVVAVDETAVFGTIAITPRACRKMPPEETPESAVFLEIVDLRPEAGQEMLFSGWMFASSPALSAMENPVYDVWVLDCLDEPPAE